MFRKMTEERRIMPPKEIKQLKRVFIASANPLFGKGLEKLLLEHSTGQEPEIRSASSMAETLSQLGEWQPDLVIVDHDDRTINRIEFLTHFVETDLPMRVMLVSLQASGAVVVYNRRTLTSAQAEDWLNLSSSDRSYPAEGAESTKPQS
jgi:cytochrome c oxidase subunit II